MAPFRALVSIIAFASTRCLGNDSPDTHGLPSFASFISLYGRSYAKGTKEYALRRDLYEQRLQQVKLQNSRAERSWSATVNHLSDRTETELSQLRGLRVMQTTKKGGRAAGVVGAHNRGQFLSQIKNTVVPDEKSWVQLNAVKQDIDQGACGSCWAIATSVMLMANAEIHGINRTFSAQELVDCVPNPHSCGGSGGCEGATVELGMNWVAEKGLEDSSTTPYVGSDTTCKKPTAKNGASLLADDGAGHGSIEDMIAVGFHAVTNQHGAAAAFGLKGWERLAENQYEPLIRAVAERGPAAVSVAASGWSAYGIGLFDNCDKDAVIDHAVTLVGYGIEKSTNQKYWLIKNSWGNSWGENGNIRLLREEGNVHCGTDYQPKVGTGCDDSPASVHVCGMCGILYDAVVPHF